MPSKWFLVAALSLLPLTASATMTLPQEVAGVMETAKRVGAAKVRFLFWPFFEASLWTPDGSLSWEAPMALSITYRTDFSAEELTDTTIEEMDRLTGWQNGQLKAFREALSPCMRAVADGDRFTAASPSPDQVVLYLNGEERCRLEEPGLRRAFFSVWLSEDSRFPDSSRALRGWAS